MLNKIHERHAAAGAPEFDPGIVDSKRLQMFYISVKEGSFAAAAQVLAVSPSAVSHAMKSLEEELGCSLFRRGGQQISPTGAAVRLLPMVEEMLVRMAAIKTELASLDGRLERVSIRLPGPLMWVLGRGALPAFYECFPAADLEIATSGEAANFSIDHVEGAPPDAVRRDLGAEEFHAWVAPFHELGQKSRVSLTELQRCLLVFPDAEAAAPLAARYEPGAAAGLKKWFVPDPRAALELARQGQAVAFVPACERSGPGGDGLVRLRLPGAEIRRPICAWWPPDRPLTWVAEVFLGLIAARLGEE